MPEKTKAWLENKAWLDAIQCNISANSQQILQSAALFLTLLYHFYTVKEYLRPQDIEVVLCIEVVYL